jgi:hypothetical protein
MANQGPEEITSAAVSDIEKKAEKVGEKIKTEKFDAAKAVRETKGEIFVIAQNSKEKIAPTEFSKKKADNIRYISRIDQAKKTADKKIDGNLEFYGNLASYIKKRTEIALMLESNKHAIKGAEADFSKAYLIKSAMEGLSELGPELTAMPAVGMEEDKASLKKQITDQQKEMKAALDGIIAEHRKKIMQYDAELAALQERLDPAKAHLHASVIGEKEIRLLYTHLYYLESLRISSTESLKMAGLTKEVEDRRVKLEQVLGEAQKMTANTPEMKDHKVLWKRYQKQRENLLRAEENMAQVKAKKSATQAELAAAEQWIAGARQTSLKPLADLRQTYVDMRLAEGNLQSFEHDREIADRGERGSIYVSATVGSFKADWDLYDKLGTDVEKAKDVLKEKKKKTSDKTELGRAYWQLTEAKRKFNAHVDKLKAGYADMGTDPAVYDDLIAEGVIQGKVRMGTTVEEAPEVPEKPKAQPTMVASAKKPSKKEKQA